MLKRKRDAASSSSAAQGEDSSSSSFPSSGWDYEVFLSFRGEDTRTNFTDHLYNALVSRGIHTFRDNEELRIGENIDPALRSAIHQSKIAIPIFSKDYASSKWCLRELAEIVECMKQQGQRQITVMPVFYHVDPSEVRHQIGFYEKAFQNHQKKFGQETEGWKKALTQVANLKGWDLKNIGNGHEGKLIQLIVKEVWSELRKRPLIVSDNLVGIHSHVEKMNKFLNIVSHDIRIVGILGLGGIGKTTIARCVYNTIHHHFEGCSFLADARETFQTRGPVHLQCQLLINILNLENPNITNVDQGIDMIKKRLSNKKVLIVVDDVDENTDLNVIIGNCDWFGVGSRIIITTRDKHILDVLGVENTYEPNEMDSDQSLLLFSKHAFKRDQPPKQYLDLSKDVIETAGGLPLALEVLGSFLIGKGESAWKDMVKKLKKIPNHKVMEKLRISYDGLDPEEKEMFLDIACFFIGIDKDFACYMWDGCDFYPNMGIEILREKSLVKIGENNELRMHDQLRDLGREIVRQENPMKPEKRSRLWLQPEVSHVLSTQRGTSKVKGLSIDFGGLFGLHIQCLESEGLASMTKLRLLQVNSAGVARNFVHSFSELRWLSWKGCPMQFTPTNLRKLVVLDLSYSRITENWMGWKYIKEAETLKVLNLSRCYELSRTPNFSGNLHLEILILEGCCNLVTIDESIGHLKRLVSLNMNCCLKLRCLPTSICELSSLKKLDIESTNIGRFPEKFGCLEALREFKFRPLQIGGGGSNYMSLSPDWEPKLIGETLVSAEWLPHSISNWRNLRTLSAEYCNIEDGETLDSIGSLSSLEFLNLKGNPFHSLPATVSDFSLLQTLSVAECDNLHSLPRLSHLTNLEVLDLKGCWSLREIPTTIDALTRLKSLDLHGCNALQNIPVLPSGLRNLTIKGCHSLRNISKLSKNLVCIEITDCGGLSQIEGLEEGVDSLEKLIVCQCDSLRKIPNLSDLKNLLSIKISSCDDLSEIEGLKGLDSLEKLIVNYCHSLRKIPNLSDSKNHVSIEISSCDKLSEIEGLKGLDSLEMLIVKYCHSLRKFPNLSDSKNLVCIEIEGCHELSEIEELKGLYSLENLIIKSCHSLRKIPNLSDLKNLVSIEISSCDELSEIEGLKGLESLEKLIVEYCHSLRKIEIEGLKGLDSLEKLIVKRCLSLRKIPNLSDSKNLVCIEIEGCHELSEIEELKGLYSLEKLIIKNCQSLRKIPNLSDSKNLVLIEISSCGELSEIEGLKGLDSLKKLIVRYCHSLRKIPNLSDSKNLVCIQIEGCHDLSEIEELKGLYSLENLIITGCHSLRKIPNLSDSKNLVSIEISSCDELYEIEGLKGLDSLEKLIVRYCHSLRKIPNWSDSKNHMSIEISFCNELSEIEGLKGFNSLEKGFDSLEKLIVKYCRSLRKIPNLSYSENLVCIEIQGCHELSEIEELKGLYSLEKLIIKNCHSVRKIPNLSDSKNLVLIEISSCDELSEIEGLKGLDSLKKLIVRYCHSLRKIPNLSDSKNLVCIEIEGCHELSEIEELQGLYSLKNLIITGCHSLRKIPNLSYSKNLVSIEISSCDELYEIEGLKGLDSLEKLIVNYCHSLRKIPNLSDSKNHVSIEISSCNELSEIEGLQGLDSLKMLIVKYCRSLRKFPNLSDSKNLVCIEIEGCHELSEIEELKGLYSLENLIITGCHSLRKLPNLSDSKNHMSLTKNHMSIEISSCDELSEIEGLKGLDSLQKLIVMYCRSLRKIPNLSYSHNLVCIEIQGCHELSEIEELKGLYSLEKLIIKNCHSLRKIPNLSDLKNHVLIEISSCDELSEIEGLDWTPWKS